MAYQQNRAEWIERNCRIIAELSANGALELWERDAWEVRWYPATRTTARIDKAKRLLKID